MMREYLAQAEVSRGKGTVPCCEGLVPGYRCLGAHITFEGSQAQCAAIQTAIAPTARTHFVVGYSSFEEAGRIRRKKKGADSQGVYSPVTIYAGRHRGSR